MNAKTNALHNFGLSWSSKSNKQKHLSKATIIAEHAAETRLCGASYTLAKNLHDERAKHLAKESPEDKECRLKIPTKSVIGPQ